MKTHITFLFAILALFVSSCDLPEKPATPADVTFTSEIVQPDDGQGPATRTYMDGTGENIRLHWTADDAIAIFFSTYGQKFLFKGKTGDRGGVFAAESVVFSGGFETDRYYAIYPYREEVSLDETDGTITTVLPDTQTWAEGSFGAGSGVMTAVTQNRNDYHLSFFNALCFLKLQLYGTAKVRTVTLQGNNNEPLAGTVLIETRNENGPAVSFPAETPGSTTLTLDCPEGVTLGTTAETATAFIFALPPTTFSKGFTFTITDTEGRSASKSTQKTISIERNHIQPMEAFLLETAPPEPEMPELPEVNSTLPVLYIYTPNETPVVDKVTWIADSHAYLKDAEGKVTDLGAASVKGRGNTTWNMPKKPYALKLDKKASLLGMPKDKRWDLLANYVDRTRLRNDVALELGRRLGPDHEQNYLDWTPRGEFVELVLNGTHMGNYYLVEHIKVASNRVPITEMKSTDIDAETITGGYILEFGVEMDEVNKFYTNSFPDKYPYKDGLHGGENSTYKLPVMIKEPDEKVLVTEQYNWIKNYINGIQSNIVNNNGGWTGKVDMDSFICWMFVQEVVGNYEPFHPKSCYMHLDRGGKLMMGPLWDFDYATFKANYTMTPVYHYAIWYPYMLKNSTFKARVKELYPTVRHLLRDVVNNYIDARAAEIKASVEKDWEMWPTTNNANGDINSSFDAAVSSLKGNLNRRLDQMTTEVNNM